VSPLVAMQRIGITRPLALPSSTCVFVLARPASVGLSSPCVKDDFSERLVELAKQRGFTSRTMSRKLRVDESMTSRWLRGETSPRNRADVVKRLLGMSLAEFYSVDVKAVRAENKARLKAAA
jgi:hypothetical protein